MVKELEYLLSPLSILKGFGEKTLTIYKKLLISNRIFDQSEPKIIDLIYHKPERVQYRTENPNLIQVQNGEYITVKVIIDTIEKPFKYNQPFRIICSNETGFITIVYFRVPEFLKKYFEIGKEITISGKAERFNNELQISHPDYVNNFNIPKFEQVYPLTYGLSNRVLRQSIQIVLKSIPELPEWLDKNFLFERQWKSWKESIIGLHNIQKDEEKIPFIERLSFDELLANQIALCLIREKLKTKTDKISLENKEQKLKEYFLKKLPFELTSDQKNVVKEIENDIYSNKRMLRLLQGDVGSGKTIVAFLTMLPFLENKKQTVLMVPTSVLATQHYEWFKKMCDDVEIVKYGDEENESDENFVNEEVGSNSVDGKNPYNFIDGGTPLAPLDRGEKDGELDRKEKIVEFPPVKNFPQFPPVKGSKGGLKMVFKLSKSGDIISLPYREDLVEKAKELRHQESPIEKRFWNLVLYNKTFEDLQWTRQKPICDFIVDFYCAEFGIVIELDGDSHDNNMEYDKFRTNELEKYGLKVIRFPNHEIMKNIEGVFESLKIFVDERKNELKDNPKWMKNPKFVCGNVENERMGKTPLAPLDRGEKGSGLDREEKNGGLDRGEKMVEFPSVKDSPQFPPVKGGKGGLKTANNNLNNTELSSKKIIHRKIKVALLTGKIKGKKREKILEDLKNGEIDILIGTHAIFQDNVEFKDLGFVVIDEQHRFGVAQRLNVIEKGKNTDVLIMTATPIPRTLALTIYGDMEVSTIKEKPKNRKEIITTTVQKESFNDLICRIKERTKCGEKVYWICPLIEESEDLPATPLYQRYEEFKKIFNEKELGFIHGKLSEDEKDKIMENFEKSSGEVKILISTTVIEVGIDVPDATIIVIENPERFGLSQMHQLRGRVGRGEKQSYCVLFYEKPTVNLRKRMEILKSSSNGFFIAEEDLKMRGSGEMLGLRQSGFQEYLIADLMENYNLLIEASKMAKYIVANKELLNGQSIKILLEMFGYSECLNEAILN